jgi:hypothetical protein
LTSRAKRTNVSARRWLHLTAVILFALLVSPVASGAADDALARAKNLYLSAAYDEALVVLDGLRTESPRRGAMEVAEYRVFCLLALNRGDEAQKAIEGIVTADPFYHPDEAVTSPRIRSIFQSTRKKLLPDVVHRAYARAKESFDRKDPQAITEFESILTLLDDPDLKGAAQVADLRTVVLAFRDLSKALAAPLPASRVIAATVAMPPGDNAKLPSASSAATGSLASVDGAPATHIASGNQRGTTQTAPSNPQPPRAAPPTVRPQDPAPARSAPLENATTAKSGDKITPPIVVSQPLPRWAPAKGVDAHLGFKGSVEVMIDAKGNVTAAVLRQSVHPLYDGELVALARTWKYRPATINGTPVGYRKIVEIQLQPVR